MILLADFFLLKQYIILGALSFDAKTVVITVFYQRKCGGSLLTRGSRFLNFLDFQFLTVCNLWEK
jgi:hypothetical protein